MPVESNSMVRFAKRVVSAIRRRITPSPDAFLKKTKGVIHIGANSGQERDQYARLGLNVAWVEPIPDVFRALQSNIQAYPKQRAFNYLVTDKDGQSYEFHVANNDGASSSILELELHEKLWPDIAYTRTLSLKGITLCSLVEAEQLDKGLYDALVLDTQGSELLVLRGAESLLPSFQFIKTEVPDFRAYRDCCVVDEIDEYLSARGFKRINKHRFKSEPNVGSYFDVVYRNTLA